MKLTSILVLAIASATAVAQNPDVIQNTRDTLHAVQQKKAMDSNAALAPSQGQSASSRATAKPAPSAKPAPAVKPAATARPTVVPAAAPAKARAQKVPVVKAAPQVTALPKGSNRKAAQKSQAAAKKAAPTPQKVEVANQPAPEGKKEVANNINLTGRRDPFVSPVVNRSMVGSGCSTGKKCLAIDQINLKGVVKADTGMIAVVVNAMNKAYFLRENDPVFNGYVVKITGDSIVFKETIQDKLGKPFTREVTKKITTSAV